jgi:hypothetical protein
MVTHRITRRELFKLSGAAVLTATLQVTRWPIPALAEPAIRSEWTFSDGIPETGAFETPPLQPETRYDAVDVSWRGTHATAPGLRFLLRTQDRDGYWSEWEELHPDTHGPADELATNERGYIAPVLRQAVAVQVRIFIESGARLDELTVGTLDVSGGEEPLARSTDLIDGFIIPRAGWGADERLRHVDQDPNKPIKWTPRYRTIEKIIVHHTVTENNPSDVGASLRAIYYYHAVTQGWGDIGYNFLIDWRGNVYEGRFGGPNVIGGHALQYNSGSLGIALLGNFTSVAPPEPMLDSLVRLIRTRASHVDVTKATDWVDLVGLANLCGHGDVLPTACPGDRAYPLLPAIRGRIAGTGPIYIARPKRKEWLDYVACTLAPQTAYPANLLEVRMRVRNDSVTTIVSSGPPPGFVYEEGQDFDAAGFPKIENTYRWGIDFQGNTATPNPYRWGFGAPIPPGSEREVVGYVRLRSAGSRTYSAAIVKEFSHYLSQGQSPQRITVGVPPVGPVADLRLPGGRYFSVTGHNVPKIFADFWEARGGLRRFGYPMTEAFEEVSETDGGRYLTQYFERARFEYHPEYAGTEYEVLLGLLGAEIAARRRQEPPFRPIASFSSSATRTYFAETQHSLGGIFKRIWEERGGLRIFGYPISEEFAELSETDGNWHVVQYFERNRFEHHPDYAGTYDEVMLGHLGREILIRRGWMKRPGT